jgi:molecular chaperone DnaJ
VPAKDYYATLGVSPTASPAEITKAYRALARTLHPDTNPAEGSAERFKEVAAAYDVVGKESSRATYDAARRVAATQQRPRTQSGTTKTRKRAKPSVFDYEGEYNYDDPFTHSDTFYSSFFEQHQPSLNIYTFVTLSFTDAALGITTGFSVTYDTPQGPQEKTVQVRLPAGVEDGQTVILAKKGRVDPDRSDSPGDLFITITVAPDDNFSRQGSNLLTTARVSALDAILGTTLRVATLATPVSVKIPPGTGEGAVFRVKGRGVTTKDTTGDLLVRVIIEIPRKLTKQQRAAYEGAREQLQKIEQQ